MQLTVRVPIDVPEPGARARTVLVMSEDGDWRGAVQRALEQEGYRVIPARHSGQAIVESTRLKGRVDLLLTGGSQEQPQPDFPTRIFTDRPEMKLLHLGARARTREELVAAIAAALR